MRIVRHVLSAAASIALHVPIVALLTASLFSCGRPTAWPWTLSYDNPYFGRSDQATEFELYEPVRVVPRFVRSRMVPPREDRLPEYDSQTLELRDAEGAPVNMTWSPEMGRVLAEFPQAKGVSIDFVSDKPHLGRGTYDTLGAGRGGGGRYGGPAARLDPVHFALAWLARHQLPDGSWSATRRVERCGCPAGDGAADDASLTALAVLAFLGAGYSHRATAVWDGVEFGGVLRRALKWLAARPADGHALAALAMCQALAADASPLFEPETRKAVAVALSAPTPAPRLPAADEGAEAWAAGWRVLLVKSAVLGDFDVPETLADAARESIDDAADPLLLLDPARWGGDGRDPHAWYFVTLALAHRDLRPRSPWRDLGNRITRATVALQHRERPSCAAGSWGPTESTRPGGRVLATALAALLLEACPGYLYLYGTTRW